MAAPPSDQVRPGYTSISMMPSHPLLKDLADKTNHILDVFGNLPADIQMDGLDMLQNVVNAVMQKITAGRVTAVKFVPVEGSAVAGESFPAHEVNHIKEEPVWNEDTEMENGMAIPQIQSSEQELTSHQSSNVSIISSSKKKSAKNVKQNHQPMKGKSSNSQEYAKDIKNSSPKNTKKTKSTEPLSVTLKKKKIDDARNKPRETKEIQKMYADGEKKKPLNTVKATNKTQKKGAIVKFSTSSNKVTCSESINVIDAGTPDNNEDNVNGTNKDDDEDSEATDEYEEEDSTLDASVSESNTRDMQSAVKVTCKDEVTALLEPGMRMQSLEKRKKRKPRDTPGRYKCDFCDYSSDKKFHYDSHMIVHTGEKKYVCDKCDKVFTANSSLKRHLMAHKGLKPHQCPICGRTFIDLSALRIHSVVHTDEMGYECPVCFKDFLDLNALYEHEIQHEGERLYKCDECDKMYTNSANLSRHRRVHTGEMPYHCKVEGCEAKFRDLSSLKLHNLKHTGEKPYACEFCGMKFKTSSDYLRHKRSHTNERNYECELCHKKFIQGWHLKQHQRMHADHRPWVCELCDKKFRSKASLNHHTKWHRGIKEFKCDTCNKMFSTKKYLEAHQVIHTNDKPFMCKTCGSHFNQISNLRRHQRIHSDVKQYKCHFCPKAFKYINSWRYHEGTHKGSKYTCEKCGMTFRSPQGYKAHKCSTDSKEFAKIGTDFESFILESSQDKKGSPNYENQCVTKMNPDSGTQQTVDDVKGDGQVTKKGNKGQAVKNKSSAAVKMQKNQHKKQLNPLKIKLKSPKIKSTDEGKKRKPSLQRKSVVKNNQNKSTIKRADLANQIAGKANGQNKVNEEELDLMKTIESHDVSVNGNNVLVLNNDTNESIIVLKTEVSDEGYEIQEGENVMQQKEHMDNSNSTSIENENQNGISNNIDNSITNSIQGNSIPNGDITDDISLILTNQVNANENAETSIDYVFKTKNVDDENSSKFQNTLVSNNDEGDVDKKIPSEDQTGSVDDVAIMKDAYIDGTSNPTLHVTNIFGVIAGR